MSLVLGPVAEDRVPVADLGGDDEGCLELAVCTLNLSDAGVARVGVVLVLMSLMSFVSCEKESSSSEGYYS